MFLPWLRGYAGRRQSKLWVDDVRPAPAGWTAAQTYDEALALLESGGFDVVSLDHDLADTQVPERTGYHLLLQIVQRKMDGVPIPREVRVHSANPVGAERMEGVIARYLRD